MPQRSLYLQISSSAGRLRFVTNPVSCIVPYSSSVVAVTVGECRCTHATYPSLTRVKPGEPSVGAGMNSRPSLRSASCFSSWKQPGWSKAAVATEFCGSTRSKTGQGRIPARRSGLACGARDYASPPSAIGGSTKVMRSLVVALAALGKSPFLVVQSPFPCPLSETMRRAGKQTSGRYYRSICLSSLLHLRSPLYMSSTLAVGTSFDGPLDSISSICCMIFRHLASWTTSGLQADSHACS